MAIADDIRINQGWGSLPLSRGSMSPPPAPTGKVDLSKPVRTADGRTARVLCTDRSSNIHPLTYCVVVLVETKGARTSEQPEVYDLKGEPPGGHDPDGPEWGSRLVNI
jgi:hypothetical protein